MSNPQRPQYDIRKRAEWILRLLYAPDSRGRKKGPLFGKTRMMKACFLIHRKMGENFPDVETGFDFRPDKYGPLDPDVYSALSLLETEEKITIEDCDEHSDKYESTKYSLTKEGARKAETLFIELPEKQQELVKWVKSEHALKNLNKLLVYVYDEYPEMTTKSELV